MFAAHSFICSNSLLLPIYISVYFSIGYLAFSYELMFIVYFRHFYVIGHL